MTLFLTLEARDDRRAIYDYVEAYNPRAALTLDELFSTSVRHLIYDTTVELVRVLRALHAARQWPPVDR